MRLKTEDLMKLEFLMDEEELKEIKHKIPMTQELFIGWTGVFSPVHYL